MSETAEGTTRYSVRVEGAHLQRNGGSATVLGFDGMLAVGITSERRAATWNRRTGRCRDDAETGFDLVSPNGAAEEVTPTEPFVARVRYVTREFVHAVRAAYGPSMRNLQPRDREAVLTDFRWAVRQVVLFLASRGMFASNATAIIKRLDAGLRRAVMHQEHDRF